jgi:hypothetical protein
MRPRGATHAEGDVEGDGAGGDDGDGSALVAAQPHDRALSELPVDLGEGRFEGLLAVGGDGMTCSFCSRIRRL